MPIMSRMSVSGEGSCAPGREAVSWGWGLDVLMAITILVTLYALALGVWSTVQFKAKATEQLLAGTNLRAALIEHYVVTGDWRVSGETVPRDFATAAPGAIQWQSRHVVAGIVDGVVVTLGRYPGLLDGVAILTFRPAVATTPEQPTVRWLCGHAPTPRGWESPTVSPAANLPDKFLYSLCRKGASP